MARKTFSIIPFSFWALLVLFLCMAGRDAPSARFHGETVYSAPRGAEETARPARMHFPPASTRLNFLYAHG
ncbi:MAG: hypothetical protein LIP28_06005 [Deltaproteobacteria bacterium]|nr:hypothetical protein [Deltaproteobacteria bacterium]